MSAPDWVATLKAEPWYASVQQAFAAKNIADPLWQATLYAEDQSLNPATSIVDSNGVTSTGLFQLNANGVGAGYSMSVLTDPVQNATIAAQRMAAQIATEGTGSASLDVQLRSIERAGWNGSTTQDATRQADLALVQGRTDTAQSPGQCPAGWPTWACAFINAVPGSAQAGQAGNAFGKGVTGKDNATTADVTTSIPGAIAAASATVQTLALQFTLGAVFLALIAGGFALAASDVTPSVTVKP